MGEMACLAFGTEFTVINNDSYLQINTKQVMLGVCFCQLCGFRVHVDL